MISYKVIITPKALSQLDSYIAYVRYTLLNPQAAKSIWLDAMETQKQLKLSAGSLRLCENPVLSELGYHPISFIHHNYVMLYRIDGSTVYVEAIFHQQQDYENTFSKTVNQ